jgi:outer membrane protein OmpA-like peptidoglycan-associated protein
VTGLSGSAQQADGTYISPTNSLLTTVFVLSPIWVNFSISENEAQSFRDQVRNGRLRLPQDGNYVIEILLVDGSPYPHQGRITFADPSFNSQTGTFQVRASVINPDGLLRPNQFVRVKVKGAVRPNAVLVPQRAVQQGAKGHFVWVVKEGKAELRPVKVGDWLGSDWFISEGLNKGEEVVVDGVLTLAPGAPVAAKPLAVAPAAAVAPAQPAAAAGKGAGPQAPADPLAPPLDTAAPAKAGAGAASTAPSDGSTPSAAPLKSGLDAGRPATAVTQGAASKPASSTGEVKPAARAGAAAPAKADRARAPSTPSPTTAAAKTGGASMAVSPAAPAASVARGDAQATVSGNAQAGAPGQATTPAASALAAGASAAGSRAAGRGGSVEVHFTADSADLTAVGRAVVDTTAALVQGRNSIVEVSGYVDRYGPPGPGAELAKRRAEVVRDALVSSGVPAARVRLVKPVELVGVGVPAQGRHVEIRVLAD